MGVKKSNIKCKGCGGNLVFSPSHSSLFCENCQRTEKIDFEKQPSKKDYTEDFNEETKIQKTTNCSTCGAQLVLNPREITKNCQYCGSSFVVDSDEIIGLKPDAIIPFSFDKTEAVQRYKKNVRKKLFLPNAFKKAPSFESLHSTYVSCFSFDVDTSSTYSGKLNCTETYFVDGKPKIKHYTRKISGSHSKDFRDCIIEASKQTDQESFDQIKPFQINENSTFKYDEDFIRGYEVESYDQGLISCKLYSQSYIKDIIKKEILSKYSYSSVAYFNLTTHFSNYKYSYVLLPVYFFNIKYKEKEYLTYLNGQTGKLGDNLPKSKVKIFFAVLGVLLLLALFYFLGSYLSSLQ